jgi:uncharacterized membrane protein YfcA
LNTGSKFAEYESRHSVAGLFVQWDESVFAAYKALIHLGKTNQKEGTMGSIAGYLILGLFAGIASGLIGLGGGFLIVPALVFLFGMSQHQAQGTTLAMLVPPIGILAAWTYYQRGFVDIKVAAFIAAGFFVGSAVGARFATGLSSETLEKIFGVALVLIGMKMILGK